VRNIAGAFGIAIFATILNNATNSNVLNIARNSFANIKNPFVMKQFTGLIILKAQVAAYGTVFAVSSAFLFVGAILALTIKVKEKIKPSGEEVLILE
ncbi:MAG: hypothetical protein V1814_00885, partial [Candidatus Moraniibacteriota bacterium]